MQGNKSLLCKPAACDILLWQPEQTNTVEVVILEQNRLDRSQGAEGILTKSGYQ